MVHSLTEGQKRTSLLKYNTVDRQAANRCSTVFHRLNIGSRINAGCKSSKLGLRAFIRAGYRDVAESTGPSVKQRKCDSRLFSL